VKFYSKVSEMHFRDFSLIRTSYIFHLQYHEYVALLVIKGKQLKNPPCTLVPRRLFHPLECLVWYSTDRNVTVGTVDMISCGPFGIPSEIRNATYLLPEQFTNELEGLPLTPSPMASTRRGKRSKSKIVAENDKQQTVTEDVTPTSLAAPMSTQKDSSVDMYIESGAAINEKDDHAPDATHIVETALLDMATGERNEQTPDSSPTAKDVSSVEVAIH
jgi:hypothetical protein